MRLGVLIIEGDLMGFDDFAVEKDVVMSGVAPGWPKVGGCLYS
jgi:hypothetical protein